MASFRPRRKVASLLNFRSRSSDYATVTWLMVQCRVSGADYSAAPAASGRSAADAAGSPA